MVSAPVLFTIAIGVALASPVLLAAQAVPPAAPLVASCATGKTELKMVPAANGAGPADPAPDKALVYVIEEMPEIPFVTTHVKVGVDGGWVGQLSGHTYLALSLEPGVHHFCARYDGKVAAPQLDSTILHRLDAKAGQVYYLLYRGFITKEAGEVGSLDLVDEDEGQYVLHSAQQLVTNP